jgi:hypothetical protein
MDQHSILDRSPASPAVEGDMAGEVPGKSGGRSATASVSAGIAAANAHLPKPAEAGPRFPAEDGGRSLAEMAHRDLDAALQLLVERAQYITGATGAAIALRRGQNNDMLCRASAGSNAPELGALLSMEYGLSGESVRTRQALRCDDVERDPRVNREGCRQLGIASVVVMPIVTEEQVLGVFELFSGEPRAFEERDISALQRLSEMVETAVKHAVATQTVSAAEENFEAEHLAAEELTLEDQAVQDAIAVEPVGIASEARGMIPDIVLAPSAAEALPPAAENTVANQTEPGTATGKSEPAVKKPLFWSAALQTQGSAERSEQAAASSGVPPVLRNLQKCQACGFPVSQGRTFCVECEEKQWRGQRLPKTAAGGAPGQTSAKATEADKQSAIPAPAVAVGAKAQQVTPAPTAAAGGAGQTSVIKTADVQSHIPDTPADFPASGDSTLFLSSAAPSESWFAANKYIVGALLVVAIVIGAIVWLR